MKIATHDHEMLLNESARRENIEFTKPELDEIYNEGEDYPDKCTAKEEEEVLYKSNF